ncbi:hypothetical protein [Hymenobacter volaticus]|uniref:Uncharacterized protein n=1 Tax=Hymenobacter volaticus TaxID=2932254 RepID=A0ABY4G1S8_9BACT|nr:hypothetical protein [Hymenobacter volaticus]UOQ64817.1 hypothetical protein MUN86_14730 [Hymenobacter volaticus]
MIRVDELIISVPDMDPKYVTGMVHRVLQLMADKMPAEQQSRSISKLSLSVLLQPDMSSSKMEEAVAQQLMQQIRMI